MSKPFWQLTEQVVPDSVLELFRSYGVPVAEIDPKQEPSGTQHIAAFIGFSGDTIKGSLSFVAPRVLLERTCPIAERGERQIRDWSGELANQILGRIKNKLVSRGVEFSVSTPASISGISLMCAYKEGLQSFSFQVALHERMRVLFESVLESSFRLLPENSDVTVPEAGEPVLF